MTSNNEFQPVDPNWQYQQYGQIPGQQPGQPGFHLPQPPKKKHTGCKIAGGIVGGIAVLAVLGSLANGSSSDDTVTPPPADTYSAPAAPAPSSVAPEPTRTTLMKESGDGIESTDPFSAPDGFRLHYHYDCTDFGMTGNFIVTVYQGSDLVDVVVNALDYSGSDSIPVYDAGDDLHLEVNSECSWTVKAVG